MPVLAAEPDIYPIDLLDQVELNAAEERAWWALYCRPNQEKQLMRRLLRMEVPFYAPLVPTRRRSPAGRIHTSYMPLFQGYVFLWGDEGHRYDALTTSCVSRWLPVPNPLELTHDLRDIRRLIEIGAPLTAESRLQPGTRVRIRSGAFMGFEGTIIRRDKETRLMVAVNFLQQGASVLLEDCQVEMLV